MWPAFVAYLSRCGIEFDISINVLTGGKLGQTVSYRVADADREGKRWGCVFCWFLYYFVQPDHCALQFVKGPSTFWTYIRAGIAFGVAIAILVGVIGALYVFITGHPWNIGRPLWTGVLIWASILLIMAVVSLLLGHVKRAWTMFITG
jgi:hypothetical protein